jgi:hypothetical protein
MAVVLFTDLVGSTQLRSRLGEEAADDLRRVHDGVRERRRGRPSTSWKPLSSSRTVASWPQWES